MPKGSHLDRKHQILAGMAPRPGRTRKAKADIAAEAEANGESLEEATLRLQRARADTEELDKRKRQIDIDIMTGRLITKDHAVDLAQKAVLRVVQILDLIPERLRDMLPPSAGEYCDALDTIIKEARKEIADG